MSHLWLEAAMNRPRPAAVNLLLQLRLLQSSGLQPQPLCHSPSAQLPESAGRRGRSPRAPGSAGTRRVPSAEHGGAGVQELPPCIASSQFFGGGHPGCPRLGQGTWRDWEPKKRSTSREHCRAVVQSSPTRASGRPSGELAHVQSSSSPGGDSSCSGKRSRPKAHAWLKLL